MLYNVEKKRDFEYVDLYRYTSKNIYGQIINCESYLYEGNQYNFSFYVTSKRKKGFQSGQHTGKDGIKSFLWAKKCLIDYLLFFKEHRKGCTLHIFPDNKRLLQIYKYALLPLGFTIRKSKSKELIYKAV
jgi:hypothetical protein